MQHPHQFKLIFIINDERLAWLSSPLHQSLKRPEKTVNCSLQKVVYSNFLRLQNWALGLLRNHSLPISLSEFSEVRQTARKYRWWTTAVRTTAVGRDRNPDSRLRRTGVGIAIPTYGHSAPGAELDPNSTGKTNMSFKIPQGRIAKPILISHPSFTHSLFLCVLCVLCGQ